MVLPQGRQAWRWLRESDATQNSRPCFQDSGFLPALIDLKLVSRPSLRPIRYPQIVPGGFSSNGITQKGSLNVSHRNVRKNKILLKHLDSPWELLLKDKDEGRMGRVLPVHSGKTSPG